MVAVKTKRISTLIETQLPEFISTEYELFSKFVTKYYEAQEVQGGTLDIINNIQKYGNTTAGSIPIALTEAWENSKINDGDIVVLAAFGSGFTLSLIHI